MKFLDKYLPNVLFALHVLLVFLLLFESRVVVPVWLQPVGRMHPLMLHFPLALLVVLGILQLFKKEFPQPGFNKIHRFLLQITTLCTVLAALMGLFLSLEEGYTGETLAWHKWGGVLVSFLAYFWLVGGDFIQTYGWTRMGLVPVLFVAVLATGHLGANLTHGEDFLWAPLLTEEATIFTPASTSFEVAIAPILKRKCEGCHNLDKQKGQLNMATLAGLRKGGEHGPMWEAGDPGNSLMIQRALLPLDHEEHMPPRGKTQLTPQEIDLLDAWIASGADLEKPIESYREGDAFIALVKPLLNPPTKSTEPTYEFEFASLNAIEELNTAFRTVVQEAPNSPALHAQLFVRQAYTPESLQELISLKDQITQLNLTNMPIEDTDIAFLARFLQMEKLILNGADVTGKGLNQLKACKKLKSLSLSSTQVDASIFPALEEMEQLEELFIWDTAIDSSDVVEWQQKLPTLNISLGFIPDENEVLGLSPPQLLTKARIVGPEEPIELKHSFPGVEIRYTLDGSTPDSTDSPLYTEPLSFQSLTQLTTKAFRVGWRSSEAQRYTFFVKGIQPEEVKLLIAPHPKYPAQGPISLIDSEKGDPNNFRQGAWMGYKEKPFQALIDFGDSIPEIEQITVSYLKNIGSYIMPPKVLKVWGGNKPGNMQLLAKERPDQPTKEEPSLIVGHKVSIPASSYRYYKIEAQPVNKLPSWHRGAGDQGWVFVDEVMCR